MAGLHNSLHRLLSTAKGVHYVGLQHAARDSSELGTKLRRKLRQIDITYNLTRHLTEPACAELLKEVADAVSTVGKDNKKQPNGDPPAAFGGKKSCIWAPKTHEWTKKENEGDAVAAESNFDDKKGSERNHDEHSTHEEQKDDADNQRSVENDAPQNDADSDTSDTVSTNSFPGEWNQDAMQQLAETRADVDTYGMDLVEHTEVIMECVPPDRHEWLESMLTMHRQKANHYERLVARKCALVKLATEAGVSLPET
mmetsp:Transcript_70537/g.139969  ORF Transcript_70537/g.139969 Transcript_70537/m.139969 type:complete len:255 (-) Transcript_70537:281-1045(-)